MNNAEPQTLKMEIDSNLSADHVMTIVRKMNETSIRCLDEIGGEVQIERLIEEMAELTVELCKRNRKHNGNAPFNIITEIADVHIMMAQITLLYGADLVMIETERKLDRLNERLDNGTI